MEGRVGSGASGESRGQTETIAVVLILSMTLVGATVVLAFGASGLNEARADSQEAGIQNAMTQFDSRAAMVALGSSPSQYVELGSAGEGGYRVDPDAGWINITHSNYDGSGSSETIYNESLGALVYEREDTTVVYQGGGVWTSQGGESQMVSPPEFHYQGSTLTMLVMQLEGSAGMGGSDVTAKISKEGSSRIYPNSSEQYPATSDAYGNPVREGNVTVTVKSDYYRAWADYFRTRTAGEVSVDHAAGTVALKLITFGTVGDFEMPADGNAIELRGLTETHDVSNFTIRIRPDDSDAANFANLQWTLYADQGNQEFEIHLRKGGNNNDPATPCTELDVDATVYYSDKNGDQYHGWKAENAFRTDCGDLDGDGDSETFLDVNLTGTTQFEVDSLSQRDLSHFSPGDTQQDPVTFDEHGDKGVDWEDPGTDFADGDTTSVANLTNHYLSLLDSSVDLTVEDKSSDTVNEDASSGTIEYDGTSAQFITFLHISENRVTIELE